MAETWQSFHCPLTSIAGIRIGHYEDDHALTGCTVILCDNGAVGGVDQRGGAPGTRQTDAMYPMHLVEHVNAVVLAGGSAFGLDAASGVVQYLEEQEIGFDVRVAKVPIVPAAILFDLNIGRADIRPTAQFGYQACLRASREPPAEGNVGAGCGATVGKILGIEQAMKAGLGSACYQVGRDLKVGALVAVNAFGDIIDPQTGQIIAGARLPAAVPENRFADTLEVMRSMASGKALRFGSQQDTVIGVVITNARLNKEETNKVAQMAQDGLARAVRPAHTMLDGDTIFALSTGEHPADVNAVGAFAAEAVTQAILNAVKAAKPAGGLPSWSSLQA